MKKLKDYEYLIPLWMRDDENFMEVYRGILNVLIDIQQTKEDIIRSFSFKPISEEDNRSVISTYNSSLEMIASYFGINRNFYLSNGDKVIAVLEDSGGNLSVEIQQNVPINIRLSNETMLRLIKFNFLKSNFDGTMPHLLENYDKMFRNEPFSIQFLEGMFEIVPNSKHFLPILNLNLVPDKHRVEFLDEATLFLNGAFNFNFMGVATKYSVGGQTAELVWDKSRWDKSKWKV